MNAAFTEFFNAWCERNNVPADEREVLLNRVCDETDEAYERGRMAGEQSASGWSFGW